MYKFSKYALCYFKYLRKSFKIKVNYEIKLDLNNSDITSIITTVGFADSLVRFLAVLSHRLLSANKVKRCSISLAWLYVHLLSLICYHLLTHRNLFDIVR